MEQLDCAGRDKISWFDKGIAGIGNRILFGGLSSATGCFIALAIADFIAMGTRVTHFYMVKKILKSLGGAPSYCSIWYEAILYTI